MRFVCLLLLPLVFASCGKSGLTSVSGKITRRGEPAPNVMVIFAPKETGGITGAATTDKGGEFSISSSLGTGVPPGAYSVKLSLSEVVRDAEAAPPESGGRESFAEGGRARAKSNSPKEKDPFPAKYATGDLIKIDVGKSSSQVFNYDVTD